ncbi:Ubiquitin, partial [Trema orientale]
GEIHGFWPRFLYYLLMETPRHFRLVGYQKLPSSDLDSSQHQNNLFRRVIKVVSSTVKKFETVRNLKARLQRKKGYSRQFQEPFLENDELEHEQTTVDEKSQNLERDKNPSSNRQHSTCLKLHVKIASNKKTIVVEAKGYHVVHEIKSKILVVEGIKPDQYSLFHDGKSLEDYRTLVSLGIKTESTLHLIFHPRSSLSISVRTPSGKLPRFEVKVLYTIRDVKTITESFIGYPVSDCKMIYAGNELEDSKSLAFYGIEDNSTLDLQLSWIQIFVRTWSGKTVTLQVTRSNTIDEVKEKLFCKVGMPTRRHSLMFAGKILEENRNLSSYNVHKHSTLHMLLRH